MDYKGHLKSGTILGLILIDTISNQNLSNLNNMSAASFTGMGLGLIIGSGLPDIDHHKSYIAKKLSFIGAIISRFFSHRGFTHSIPFLIMLSLILSFSKPFVAPNYKSFYEYFSFSLMFSTFIHIFMDMFVGNGVNLFAPFFKKRFYFFKIKSGSKSERGFHSFITFCFIVYLLFRANLLDEILKLFYDTYNN